MEKNELRRRALRAAAAVTMTMSLLGCAGGVDRQEGGTDDPGDPPAQDEGATSGSPVPTGRPPGSTASSSSGTPWLDAGLADATETADAAEEAVHCEMGTTEEEYQAFVACCDAVNWDSEAGCFAWGPPVPPAMPATRRA